MMAAEMLAPASAGAGIGLVLALGTAQFLKALLPLGGPAQAWGVAFGLLVAWTAALVAALLAAGAAARIDPAALL
ncbi:MAG: hypothetical protein ACRD1Y_13650, partial [Terriglobales bacterium]